MTPALPPYTTAFPHLPAAVARLPLLPCFCFDVVQQAAVANSDRHRVRSAAQTGGDTLHASLRWPVALSRSLSHWQLLLSLYPSAIPIPALQHAAEARAYTPAAGPPLRIGTHCAPACYRSGFFPPH